MLNQLSSMKNKGYCKVVAPKEYNKNEIILQDSEGSKYLININNISNSIIKYSNYKILSMNTDTNAIDELQLRPIDMDFAFKDQENILRIKMVIPKNNNNNYDKTIFDRLNSDDIEDQIIFLHEYQYMNDCLYCYLSFKVQLGEHKMIIDIRNSIHLNKYNWKKRVNIIIIDNDKVVQEIILKNDNDLIDFLKNYINNENPNLEKFIYIYELFVLKSKFDNYEKTFKQIWNILKTNILRTTFEHNYKELNVFKKGIEKYFLPIRENEYAKTYFSKYNMHDEMVNICWKNNISDKEKDYQNDLLKRESTSIIEFINGKSKFNIYTGEILNIKDRDYKIDYNDGAGLVLLMHVTGALKRHLYFIKTINNIWVKANENEVIDIRDRYNVLKSLS